MKQISKISMMAAVAAAALVSCAKEIEKPETPVEGEGIKISVVASNEIETKTELSGTTTVIWQATDKVGFINGEAGVNAESSTASISGTKATFTASVPSAGTYYAYYPYQADSYAPDAEGVTVRIPQDQTPTPTSFDPKADLLVSTPFTATAGSYDTPADIKFKRLGAFLRVKLVDGTTGSKLGSEYVTSVSVQPSDVKLVGRFKISGTNGLIDMNSGNFKINATYDADAYALSGASNYAYFGIKPATLSSGSTLTIEIATTHYSFKRVITLDSDQVIGAGDVLPITITLKDTDLPVKFERVWGLYSTGNTSTTYWNSFFTETDALSTPRNVAMDANYIYVAETNTTKNLWKIPVEPAGTTPTAGEISKLPVGTVASVGTWYLSCPRVVKNTSDGTSCLIVSNMNTGTVNMYYYDNGIDNDPTAVELVWGSGRLGDTFSVWTPSTNGRYNRCQLWFDGMFSTDGIRSWRTDLLGQGEVSANQIAIKNRFTLGNPSVETTGQGAFYAYPDNKNRGVIGYRSSDPAKKSLLVTGNSTDTWSAAGAQSFTVEELGGYLANVPCFQYVTFNGKKYLIYAKQQSSSQGLLMIVEGEESESWETIVKARNSGRALKYYAAIQNDSEFDTETAGNGGSSGNDGMDIAVWQTDTEVRIAVLKQGVGLSLFKMSL